jgi:multidrug efflux pump subunit AcrB
MNRNFNISEWALAHRSFVWFLVVIIVAAGGLSYLRLGRNEDPNFTIKTMVVQVLWPGANITDTLQQVTDRVEKKLQETPGLDYTRSYTVAGTSTVFITLKGSVVSRDVPDVWYQVRKKIGDIRQYLPQGIVGPFFNDEFGDTYGVIYAFTADGFTHRELRDYVESVRTRFLAINDVSKIDIFGAQDEKIYIEFSTHKLAGLHLDRQASIRAIQAQNAVTPAGRWRSSSPGSWPFCSRL